MGTNCGSAYIFRRDGSIWTQIAKVAASDGAAGDEFGEPVAISGRHTIIGSHWDDDKGAESGSAYIFENICNEAPVANAGEDQTVYAWIDGMADVTLDGSDSNDPDGDDLSYSWTWAIDGNDYAANGVGPTIELPVGEHTIELIVNDGALDSEPNTVDVNVVGRLRTCVRIFPMWLRRSYCWPRYLLALIRMPAGVQEGDISDQPLMLYPAGSDEGIAAYRQYVRTGCAGVFMIGAFSRQQFMNAVPENGPVEVSVVGTLDTGQYFYGAQIIRIIDGYTWP